MSAVTRATTPPPAAEALPKKGYHISDEDLTTTIHVFDTLIRCAEEKGLAEQYCKERDDFLSSVRQVAIDQRNWKRALFVNNVFLDNLSLGILLDFKKSNDSRIIKRLLELNSLNVSPKDISDCRLRQTIDRFIDLRRMANELSLIDLEEVLTVKYHHFLQTALTEAEQQKKWSQFAFINNIYMESMSTPVLLKCIINRDKKELMRVLKIGVIYISPSVLEASKKYPDIHRILTDYLRDSNHLIRAAQRGMLDYVNLSLKHGANPNMQKRLGETALHCAASAGASDIVRVLLEKGADPNIADIEGRIPVIYAFDAGCKDVLNLLMPVSTLNLSNNPHVSFQILDVNIQ